MEPFAFPKGPGSPTSHPLLVTGRHIASICLLEILLTWRNHFLEYSLNLKKKNTVLKMG